MRRKSRGTQMQEKPCTMIDTLVSQNHTNLVVIVGLLSQRAKMMLLETGH